MRVWISRAAGLLVAATAVAACTGTTGPAAPGSSPAAPTGTASSGGGPTTSEVPSPGSSATTASPAPTSPSGVPPSSPGGSPVPAGMTRIDLVVSGCEGCRIFAYQLGTLASPVADPTQVSGVVRSGRLSLLVPTNRTRGMYFLVACTGDRCNSSNAQPVVALEYRGQAVGSTLNDAAAATRKQASGCWAGTIASTARIELTATFFPDVIFTRRAYSMRIWANPQVAVVPNTWLDTYKGGLGTQTGLSCG